MASLARCDASGDNVNGARDPFAGIDTRKPRRTTFAGVSYLFSSWPSGTTTRTSSPRELRTRLIARTCSCTPPKTLSA
jgi:hypothetical protein